MAKRYTSEGIILSKLNYGEGDKILTIFTKERGRVSVLAKGVRKLKSRKRGAVEIFNKVKYVANTGKGIDTMSEVEIIDGFKGIENDLKKTAVAYFFMEVVLKLIREEEINIELYDFISDYLSQINNSASLKKLRSKFVHNILVLLGYWPSGEVMIEPDLILREIAEREITTIRVGKQIQV